MPGCFKVLTAADIPKGGQNNFLPYIEFDPEEVSLRQLNYVPVRRTKLLSKGLYTCI